MAALVVVASHLSNDTGILNFWFGHGGGQLGVMLFFSLSGFLMGKLYLARPITPALALRFIKHRGARVFPLYLAVVLISAVGTAAMSITPYRLDWPEFANAALFISAPDVLWTVPIEIQFYISFLVAWLALGKHVLLWSIALLLALAVAFISLGNYTILMCLPFFLVGVVVSIVRLPRTPNALFIASLAGMSALYPVPLGALGLQISIPAMWGSPVYLLVVAAFLVAALSTPMGVASLSASPLRFLGKISYSLYLLHAPIIAAFIGYFDGAIWSGILGVAVSIAIAAISFLVVERPMQDWLLGKHRGDGYA